MRPDNDWIRWGNAWQQQPVVDVERLRRQVWHKRRQMRVVVAWRWIGAVVAAILTVQGLLIPDLPWRMKVWFVLLFLLIPTTLYLRLRQYRGTWYATGESVTDLLRITARRARAGIRLAWMSMAGACMGVLVLPAMLAPLLMPAQWPHNPLGLQHALLIEIAVNTFVQGVIMALCIRYARRQHRQLRDAETQLAQSTDVGPRSGKATGSPED